MRYYRNRGIPSSAYAMTASEEGRKAFFVVPERRGGGKPSPPRAAMKILFQVIVLLVDVT
jgi:hypothetical protein